MKFTRRRNMTCLKSGLKILLLLGIFLAGSRFYIDQKAASNASAAEASHPPLGQILMVDGIPVHAVVRGQGPDVILIHGASGNARDFTFDLVDRLDDHYRVIAFDRPGLGYTGRVTQAVNDPNGPRPETPSEQAILLEAAARQLNVDKAVVLGQSYGGAVALGWAIERPDTVSALVLVSAVTTPWNTDLEGWYALMEHNIGPSFVAPMVSAFATPERADSVLNDIFSPQHPPQGYRNYVGVGLTTRLNSLISNANQVNALHDYITDIQS
ncbi:MAG: alpha/beta hydrolase, partial [Hyphomicrobiales bacterium]